MFHFFGIRVGKKIRYIFLIIYVFLHNIKFKVLKVNIFNKKIRELLKKIKIYRNYKELRTAI